MFGPFVVLLTAMCCIAQTSTKEGGQGEGARGRGESRTAERNERDMGGERKRERKREGGREGERDGGHRKRRTKGPWSKLPSSLKVFVSQYQLVRRP